ncbi:ATP-binding protein [Paludibacterium purpuratum]|uniref:Virulence sensor protein BvgS n=1 Tax=Paludibacterium purpuratum TaxID=1144873 RepID=A0A4R7B9E3_9NEIS|nr:ATP-binding protein [Paludibacterium purpuratum]TDR81510.1 PAS domain S-box-containing protein [Paludibacterium purpuratum]
MTEVNTNASQIELIRRSLIFIVIVISVFQLISYGLLIGQAVHEYRNAQSLAEADRVSRALFSATDALARERNIYQSILAGTRPQTPQERQALAQLQSRADRGFSLAFATLDASRLIVDDKIVSSMRNRWDHFQTVRAALDNRLATGGATDETLSFELSLSIDDLFERTSLVSHELTRRLSSAPDDAIGRLAEVSYLLWQIRNQVATDGTAMIQRAQLGHLLNSSTEAELDSQRSLAANAMNQMQIGIRFLPDVQGGWHGAELGERLTDFQALSSAQTASLAQRQSSPYNADQYRQRTESLQDVVIQRFRLFSLFLRDRVEQDTRAALGQLVQNTLFLCLAILLNLALVFWLQRRVLRPLLLLNKVQDAAREAILLTNTQGRIFMANRGAEGLFALSAHQLAALNINELLLDAGLDRTRLEELAVTGQELQTQLTRKGEAPFHVSVIASPLLVHNDQKGILLIVRDDQERFNAELARRHSLEVMSDISRIQNLLFTPILRQVVFDDLLEILLQHAGGQAGLLLESKGGLSGETYRCRARLGDVEPLIACDQTGDLTDLRQALIKDPRWILFPVSLQEGLSGLVAIWRERRDQVPESFGPLLALFASVLGFVSEEESRKQSSLRLSEVLREQEAIFKASPVGLLLIDDTDRILKVNHLVSRIFGIDESSLALSKLEKLLNAPEAWALLSKQMSRVKQGKQATSLEVACKTRAGADIWLLFETNALHEGLPNEGLILSCIDITSLKRTEMALRDARDSAAESRSRLGAAIEAIPEAFGFYDIEDHMVICNQHYANLFFSGISAEQVVGESFESLVRLSLLSGKEVIEEGFSPEEWVGERVRRHLLEQSSFVLQVGERWYLASDQKIPGLGTVCLRANITDLKAKEQELLLAKSKADDANKAKSAFLASISHEIRTPLNGILGLLELLRIAIQDRQQQDTLASIQESANTLLRLIDDILDFSKIEAGKLQITPEPVALEGVLRSVHGLYQETARNKNIRFELVVADGLAPAHLADPLRLRQILQNFVSNALKFTETGKVELQVRVLSSTPEAQTLQFACIDSGIGIAQENLEKLFQPFTQAESSTTRRFGGTGLGLAICRRLADLMGGHIDMISQLGEGTTVHFEVTLPLADESRVVRRDEQPVVPEGIAFALDAPILFVEDNPINRKLTTMQLNKLGVPFQVAENGKEALDYWMENPVSLILTDCHMPVMDGHQLAREVRQIEQLMPGREPVPILACTANVASDEAAHAKEAGMNEVLTKPLNLLALQSALSRWLPQHGDQAEQPAQTAGAGADTDAIDRSALEIYSQGDIAVELSLIQEFLASEREDLAGAQAAVAAQDYEQARWFTHRIKGAGRMIGAMQLGDAAEALERCAKQQGEMGGAFEQLDAAFREVDHWVARHQPGEV